MKDFLAVLSVAEPILADKNTEIVSYTRM